MQSLAEQLAELSSRPAGDIRIERARARSIELAHRATTWGPLEPVAEIGWRTFRRDAAIGGSVLGAALAYRIFAWLLPFLLAAVLALALAIDQTEGSSGEAVTDAGLTGFVASSAADAAAGSRGWAVAIGLVGALFVLPYQSSALLRAVRAVTALAWDMPVTRVPSPTRSSLLFLGWLVAFVVVAGSAAPIRRSLAFPSCRTRPNAGQSSFRGQWLSASA